MVPIDGGRVRGGGARLGFTSSFGLRLRAAFLPDDTVDRRSGQFNDLGNVHDGAAFGLQLENNGDLGLGALVVPVGTSAGTVGWW